MTTTFAIAVYGRCCRLHFVGQQIVCDIDIVHSCWIICSLCSEFNNATLLLRLLIAVLEMSVLLHIPNITW